MPQWDRLRKKFVPGLARCSKDEESSWLVCLSSGCDSTAVNALPLSRERRITTSFGRSRVGGSTVGPARRRQRLLDCK